MITSDDHSKISVVNLNDGAIIASKSWLNLRGIQLYDDTLFYWETGYNIYTVAPNTLQPIWQYVENKADHLSANVLFKDNKVYFDNAKRIKVFNTKNGELMTEYPLDSLGGAMYWIGPDYLYANLTGDRLLCKDAKNGSIIWMKNIFISSFCIIGDSLYVRNINNKTLEKLDRYNGGIIWETSWDDYFRNIIETDKYVIVQDDNRLIYIINKDTGEKL